MNRTMAKLMFAPLAMAVAFATLPYDAFPEAQPAKKVLIWGPTNPNSRSDFTRISDTGLRHAYEELIPSAAYYASKYPDGIQLDSITSTGQPAVDLPASLDDYALVFVMFPYWDISSNQVAKLKTVTARGGRLVMIGEHGDWAPTENAVLTRLAKAMGTHFSITKGAASADDLFNGDADLLLDPLQIMPKSHHVAPIEYSGIAQEIARLKTSPNYVWAVDEVSGNGRITVFSDINWCLKERYNDPLEENSVPFLERLLSNAIECEQKVIDGDDPNKDIEEKIPDGMVAAVRDENDFLTYYKTVASACEAARQNGYTVVLKRDVSESFVLPVGVTFDTSEVTTNYAGSVTAPAGYVVRINAAHTIYKVEAVPTPEAPAVDATDGKYPDRVVVTWKVPASTLPVAGYEVRRVKVGSTLEVVLTNFVTELTFADYSAKSGVHYTYLVRAKSDAGWGWFGEDVGWTGQGVTAIPLPVAVDVEEANGAKLCDLTVSTSAAGGGEVWYGQDDETHDGVDAGRSGTVPDGGSSSMTTVVTNAGTVSFWWNASSEPSDRLSFSVDGVVRAWISGVSRSWEQRSFVVGAGTHELAWTYAKDASGRAGQDAGWVDQITWKPLYLPGAPGVVNASDGASTSGIDVTWTPSMSGGAADGYELSRSVKDSGEWTVLTNGFVGTAWTDLYVDPGVEYTYRVRAQNVAGYGPYIADDGWRRIALAVEPSIIEMGFLGGSTNIAVVSSTNWTVSASESWVDAVQRDDLSAALAVAENTSLETRTNIVTVTAGSVGVQEQATVMVVQAPRPPVMDVGFDRPYEDWRTRMQISTNTTPDSAYAPVSAFVAGEPLDISFGWTNRSEVSVSMPSVRFRIFKPGAPDRICVADWTAAGRPGETLAAGEGAWSGHWQCDVFKVLRPGDYMLEAEIAPAGAFEDAHREDNKAVFRFAVRNPALETGKSVFRPEDGWASVVLHAGNDFAQQPHVAVRAGSAGTNETAVQFGPYVPMNGKNGRTLTQSGKMPLDLVFLIDYTGSMGSCIGGLVNNIGTFIEQLVVGDPANGVEPLDDVRIKIVGFNDTENYSSKDWFVEGNFTSDVKELKNDLSRLRSTCGAGSGNAGENSFDALYYLCKGWKPSAPRTKDSPHVATSSPFRGTNEASRVVLLFTDEPPHMPFSKKRDAEYWGYWGEYSTLQPGDDGYNQNEDYCFNLLDQALKDAAVNLTIIGGNCYSSAGYVQNDKRYDRIVDGTNGDPDHREYKKLRNLAAFSGDASLLRGLATNVAAKVVATDAKIVEPALEAYVRGVGTLKFDWRNDSTAWTNNVFTFTVDGATNIVFDGVAMSLAGGTTVVTNYGGNGVAAGWHRVEVPLDDGMHHFKWNYGKIDYDGAVTDCGIVSNIQWDPWGTELDVLPASVDVDWDGVPITQTNDENAVVFDVACNSIWKVVDHSDWINVEQGAGNGDGNLVVSVSTNMTYAERIGYVTVRAGEYGLPSDDILGKPEVTVSIVQKATPYNEDGTVKVLTVDVKPRWPWNSKVDIDFRVQTPQKEGTPVRVKVWGLNKEGGDLVDKYPTLAVLGKCPAKLHVYEGFDEDADHPQPTVYDTDDEGMVYLTCPTSGLYRLTWDMGEDWYKASEAALDETGLSSYYRIWNDHNMFHSPEFAVRLQAQDEDGLLSVATAESRTVRVDLRVDSRASIDEGEDVEETDDQSTWAPAGGRILTGWEKIGHPYGAVDPVPVDTRVQFQMDGWTRLDSIDGLPIPEEFAAISNRACVINSSRVAIEGGVISSDTVWGVDKVHVVRDNVFVAPGATLTIEANAIVKFCDCTRIFVHEFDNIVGEGGLHNIVVKGATFVHGYSHVGGDTLYSREHDLSLSEGGGCVFAQGFPDDWDMTNEVDVVAWAGEKGAHIAIRGLPLWYACKVDPTDKDEEADIYEFGQTRFYSYGQKLGNLQRPSREGCSFYGWYYEDPRYTRLGYTLDPDYYEESKTYFIYPEDIPFSLKEDEGKLSDTNDPRVYALFCDPDWVTEGLVREDASKGTILLSPETVVYNGTEQKPTVNEVWIGGLQIAPANYEVDYGSGGYTDVGEYDVRVRFKVDYENSPVAKFTILPRSTGDATVSFSPASVMYDRNPSPEKPAVLVSLPDVASVPAKDYDVTWIDDAGRWPSPGKYTVVVSFKGNYTGPSVTGEFEVAMNPDYVYKDYPTEAEACEQVASNPTTKDGTAARRILYIGCRKDDALSEYVKDLLSNDIDLCDYVNENFVCWSDDVDAPGSKYRLYSGGLASDIPPILAIVSANDTDRALASHSGYITRDELMDFLETAKTLKEDASSATLELSSTRLDYTGGELKPSVTVRYAGAVIPDDNYELEWSGACTNSGVYQVKAVFNGIEYVGETGAASFEIVPAELTASAATLVPTEAVYDGETHKPDVSAVEGVTFDVDYGAGDYTVAGTYAVKVTATGNFRGTVEKSFEILRRPVSATIELDSVRAEFTEDKPPVDEVKPVVVAVREGKRIYVAGTDYDVDWGDGDYMEPGTYVITANFKGNYTGTATATFVIEIVPSQGASLPPLPADATDAQVRQEIAKVPWADPDVAAKIADAATYTKFREWLESLDEADRGKVADSSRAYVSYAVSGILETPCLFDDGDPVTLSIAEFKASEAGAYECAIELKAGDPAAALQLKAAKEAFAGKVRIGGSIGGMAPAKESDIADAVADGNKVVLKVRMPAGDSGFIMLKIE